MTPRLWTIPEGVHVRMDGSWHAGNLPMVHTPTLRYLKQHLVFEDAGAFIVDGARRMPVSIEGPAFEVVRLLLNPRAESACAVLDDGSEEPLGEDGVAMDEATGRFACRVRGGKATAFFSRAAHQTLLEQAEEEGGTFFLKLGARRIRIRA
jgi:hypothetical protein